MPRCSPKARPRARMPPRCSCRCSPTRSRTTCVRRCGRSRAFRMLLERRCGAQLDDTGRDHLGRIRAAAERMGGLIAAWATSRPPPAASCGIAPVDLTPAGRLGAGRVAGRRARPRRADRGRAGARGGRRRAPAETPAHPAAGQRLEVLARQRRDLRSRSKGNASAIACMCRSATPGCGFDMRYAHKLFEPFQRLHGPEEGGGHGLGPGDRAAHRRAPRRYDPRPSRVPGEGATFHLELPAAPCRRGGTRMTTRTSCWSKTIPTMSS